MTMVMKVSKSKFKAQALAYFRQVQELGEPLIITDRGRAVLKLIPYTEDPIDELAAFAAASCATKHRSIRSM